MAAPLWALVLSENHGLRPTGMLGGVPKPMWSAEGSPSVIEQTLSRVSGLIPGARTVTVIGPTQRAATAAMRERVDPGVIIRQPGDRGTAPGVLLGLAAILDVRPDAVVLLTPVDYALRDTDQFRLSVREATAFVRNGLADILVFGARPTGTQTTSSWLTPGRPLDGAPRQLRRMDGLVDRPGAEDVTELLRHQALWNTGVVLARGQALFDLYSARLPYMVDMLHRLLQLRPRQRAARLEEEYRVLRPAEFSRDVLGHASNAAVYTWPPAIGFTRLTGPERLEAWQRQGASPRQDRAAWAAVGRRVYGT